MSGRRAYYNKRPAHQIPHLPRRKPHLPRRLAFHFRAGDLHDGFHRVLAGVYR
jgi:hypothetical protein